MNQPKGELLLKIGTVLFLFVCLFEYSRYNDPQNAHVIISADAVVTMNPSQPAARFIAVHKNTIIGVGDQSDIAPSVRWFTKRVDYSKQTILPGLIEPHTHPILGAVLGQWLDVSGITYPTSEGVYAALQAAVDATPKGEWIYAFGLDPVLTTDLVMPDRDALDQMAPDNPVFIISQVIHTAWVNSAALAAAGVQEDIKDPIGGHFDRDATGRLTGVVHEEAIKRLLVRGEQSVLEKAKQALNVYRSLQNQYQEYADRGITSIGVLGPAPMFPGYLQFLEFVAASNSAPIRTYVMPLNGEIEKTNYTPGYQNGRYRVNGVKLHIDGSPWTGGMATAEPYLDNEFTRNVIGMKPGNTGLIKHERQAFVDLITRYHSAGWQIAVHAHGERAQELALDAFEEAQLQQPRDDHRHRLEHVGLLRADAMDRAQLLGVSPSFFVDHIYYFGPAIRDSLLGVERAERFMALKSATDRFEHVTLHMDSPATPIDPFRTLKTATNRVPRYETEPLNAGEAMSTQHALEAFTTDAAWQLFADEQIGSIEVGKQADFVVLNKNPMTVASTSWDQITPQTTWVAGKEIRRGRHH